MLQDIAPHAYQIRMEFDRKIKPDDFMLLFRPGEVLLAPGDMLSFPCCGQEKALQYLFAIDGKGFYFYQGQEPPSLPHYRWQSISVFRQKEPRWLSYAGITAYHLWTWYTNNRFCGSCGQALQPSHTERALVCPNCGTIRYPQISPAIIAAVTDGDNLLLTRYQGRPYQNLALIAGFCETGETIEDTLRREVQEETGLTVCNLRYYKSQPWPFTQSLLMGFFCDVEGSREIHTDLTELAEANWYQRDKIPYTDNGISLTGEMIRLFQQGKEPK